MIKIYHSSVRQLGAADPHGATSHVIGECETLIFQGAPVAAAEFLRATPLGVSVNVRHANGLRSCMNKPSLWADVEEYTA